jgi:hypothetical protein
MKAAAPGSVYAVSNDCRREGDPEHVAFPECKSIAGLVRREQIVARHREPAFVRLGRASIRWIIG